jgi:hypothetical protein
MVNNSDRYWAGAVYESFGDVSKTICSGRYPYLNGVKKLALGLMEGIFVENLACDVEACRILV